MDQPLSGGELIGALSYTKPASRSNHMWGKAMMTLLCLAGSACAAGAGAQTLHVERVPSAEEVVSDFIRYHEATGTPEHRTMRGPQLETVFFYPDRFGASLVDALLEELTELSQSADNMFVRQAAVSWLLAAGDTGQMGTGLHRADVVARLALVFNGSPDPAVRSGILDRLWSQADPTAAAALLVKVAETDRTLDHDDDFSEAYRAINALSKMGDLGRRELRGLHERGRVTNARARGLLEYLEERGFRPSLE